MAARKRIGVNTMKTDAVEITPEDAIWYAMVRSMELAYENCDDIWQTFVLCASNAFVLFTMRTNRILYQDVALPTVQEMKPFRTLVARIYTHFCGDLATSGEIIRIPSQEMRAYATSVCSSQFDQMIKDERFAHVFTQEDWCAVIWAELHSNTMVCFQQSKELRIIACVHFITVLAGHCRRSGKDIIHLWREFKQSNPLTEAVAWDTECDELVQLLCKADAMGYELQ